MRSRAPLTGTETCLLVALRRKSMEVRAVEQKFRTLELKHRTFNSGRARSLTVGNQEVEGA